MPVACPYFIPTVSHPRDLWNRRGGLPLGDGFLGRCGACSPPMECDDEDLRTNCNLGCALCPHLPADRSLDAVRFLMSEKESFVRVQFCGERAHLPVVCGELRYDPASASWIDVPDARLAALADAAVRVWIEKHIHR